jgi:hypothetical protein
VTPQYLNEIADGASLAIELSNKAIKRLYVGLLLCALLSFAAAMVVAMKEPEVVVVTDSGNVFELPTIVGDERAALIKKYESNKR